VATKRQKTPIVKAGTTLGNEKHAVASLVTVTPLPRGIAVYLAQDLTGRSLSRLNPGNAAGRG